MSSRTALKATLTGPLANLQTLRDQTLTQLGDLYRSGANAGQKAYLDALVSSQAEVRNIRQDLLSSLSSIKDNRRTVSFGGRPCRPLLPRAAQHRGVDSLFCRE